MSNRSLSARWKLNVSKSTSQQQLLKVMGRKPWEVSVIDKAQEDFALLHLYHPEQKNMVFDKRVTIFLDSKMLKLLSLLTRIEFDRVTYTHMLNANGQRVEHADDEKRFGPCGSATTWHRAGRGFTIRWFLTGALLKVFHTVNDQGELEVQMEVKNGKGRVEKATKIYERVPWTDADKVYLRGKLDQGYKLL